MENKRPAGRAFRPLLLVFLLVSILLVIARWVFIDRGWGRRIDVVLAGNLLLFACTWFSYYLYSRALPDKNMNLFLRMMYGSLLIKMLICLGGALLYGLLAGKEMNLKVIFCCFGLYILYTFLEVRVLMRMSKLQKNA